MAWIAALKFLSKKHWDLPNLVVHISNVNNFDSDIHEDISEFTRINGLLGPKHVAYTIFPHKLYRGRGTADRLYELYNKPKGLYKWTRSRPHRGWGTYFRRMTHYENGNGSINQLDNIVNAINNRQKIYQAAYTIVIEKPGRETIRPLGAPCLNYIAVQLTPGNPRTISLLCIYRNHDFLERAYGNYWGLCNLIKFLSEETQSTPGALTCVSSHAYVNSNKTQILELLRGIR
jgi:hypothetical protein